MNLSIEGVNLNSCIKTGQFRFLTAEISYLQDGIFNSDRMNSLLKSEIANAVVEGYNGLQITGETSWIRHSGASAQELIEYEPKLNNFFLGSACLCICQYDLRVFPPRLILNIIRTHPICIIDARAYRNFYYIPVDDMLSGNRDAIELKNWVDNMKSYSAEADELKKSKNLYILDISKVLTSSEMQQLSDLSKKNEPGTIGMGT